MKKKRKIACRYKTNAYFCSSENQARTVSGTVFAKQIKVVEN